MFRVKIDHFVTYSIKIGRYIIGYQHKRTCIPFAVLGKRVAKRSMGADALEMKAS
jgi:hypothetical protein